MTRRDTPSCRTFLREIASDLEALHDPRRTYDKVMDYLDAEMSDDEIEEVYDRRSGKD